MITIIAKTLISDTIERIAVLLKVLTCVVNKHTDAITKTAASIKGWYSIANALECQGAKLKGTRHEQQEVSQLDEIAPNLTGLSKNLQP
jgi:hypothetical protein